jgi:hypothetical protein
MAFAVIKGAVLPKIITRPRVSSAVLAQQNSIGKMLGAQKQARQMRGIAFGCVADVMGA